MSKKILLTGATGSLGSALAHALHRVGYTVIALKRRSSSTKRINSILTKIIFYDIEDLDYATLFREHPGIIAIIHTATSYGRNGENASFILDANTAFPLRLLEAASKEGVSTFINTDTVLDKYLDAYALSKSQFLQWGKYYAQRHWVQFLNVRLEYLYGPGDDLSKFAANVIASCLHNVPEIKLTLGDQRRDFIYIDDAVSACLLLLEKCVQFPTDFLQFDVGSGHAISVRDFVEAVHKITRSTTRLSFGALPYRTMETMFSVADTSALVKLGWCCKVTLEQGIDLMLRAHNNESLK
jgi:nucleoside-diphosphate-sugar epimerase